MLIIEVAPEARCKRKYSNYLVHGPSWMEKFMTCRHPNSSMMSQYYMEEEALTFGSWVNLENPMIGLVLCAP